MHRPSGIARIFDVDVHLHTALAQHVHTHREMRHGRDCGAAMFDDAAVLELGRDKKQRGHELTRRRCIDDHMLDGNRAATVHGERKRTCAIVIDINTE